MICLSCHDEMRVINEHWGHWCDKCKVYCLIRSNMWRCIAVGFDVYAAEQFERLMKLKAFW